MTILIPRRQLIKVLSFSAISLFISNAGAGDFRYQPDSESYWPRNLIRSIQQKLNNQGINSGDADGIYGPKTKKAIRDFQRSRNLRIDGKISNKLIRELGID